MKIQKLRIRNFKAIRDMVLEDLENALILVGKNRTEKSRNGAVEDHSPGRGE